MRFTKWRKSIGVKKKFEANRMLKKSNYIIFPLLLVLYELALYLTTDAYLPALPKIVHDLLTNHHLAQLTLTTWFLGMSSTQLILGPVSDRYGRRPILLAGGVVFIISTIICALTANIGILLAARFIQGAAIPSMVIAGYSTVHELFEHKKAIQTIAWMFSITVLAPAFGPLFGAAILHFVIWRWIFGILAIWAIIAILVLYFKMPEANPKGYEHPIKIKLIVNRYIRILFNANYMKSSLSFCFLFGALIAWIAAGPFLVITEFHYGTFGFAIFQIFIFGSFIVGTRLVKPMMKKYQTALLIKIGLVFAVIGSLLSLLTWQYPHTLIIIIISMMMIAAGTGFSSPPLNRVAIEASEEPMGVRMAIYSSLMSAFGFIGSGLISSVYDGKLFTLSLILVIFVAIAFLLKGFDK